jgi:hypothetical protein
MTAVLAALLLFLQIVAVVENAASLRFCRWIRRHQPPPQEQKQQKHDSTQEEEEDVDNCEKSASVVRRPASKHTSTNDTSPNDDDGGHAPTVASLLQQVKRSPSFVLKTTAAKSSIVPVLEIFPDANLEHIKGLLLNHQFNDEMVVDVLCGDMPSPISHRHSWLFARRYHDALAPQHQQKQHQSGTATLQRPLGGQNKRQEQEEEAESLRGRAIQSLWETFNFMSVDSIGCLPECFPAPTHE